MNFFCPLCYSKSIDRIEKIKTSDLEYLYKKKFGILSLHEFDGYVDISLFHCRKCDLIFCNPLLSASDEFYDNLHKLSWYYRESKDEYDIASRYISETDLVLDVGCGRGGFSKNVKSCNYTGLEFSSAAKVMAIEKGLHVLHESVQDHVRLYRQHYDVVCTFQVLEHVSNVREFLKSLIGCIKPSGFLIVSVPAEDSFISLNSNLVLNTPPHHVTWWSDECLKSISDIFEVELVELEHDKLPKRHISWYMTTVVSNVFNCVFRRPRKVVKVGITDRLINNLAWILGHLLGPVYGLGIADKKMRPYGYSVTAIYRRR